MSSNPLPRPDDVPALRAVDPPLAATERRRGRARMAGGARRLVASRGLRRALACLPVLVTTLYVLLLAEPRYVSESHIVVRHSADAPALSGGLGALLTGTVGSSLEDAYVLRDYLLSHDMLDHVEREIGFRAVFEQPWWDPVSRLWPWFRREERLAYFRSRVDAALDAKSGALVIRTQGFDPQYAQRLNHVMVREAERFINSVSQRIAGEQLEFANQELARAQRRLGDARERVLAYQNEHSLLDPTAQAESASRTVAEMETRRAQMEAELRNLQTYLLPDAPQVAALRNGLLTLRAQIDAERKQLAAPKGDRLNRVAARFQELRALLDFETDLYKLSLAALEKTRVDSARKVKYLAVVSQPMLPERALYPQRIASIVTALVATLLLLGIVRLIAGIVRDHRT